MSWQTEVMNNAWNGEFCQLSLENVTAQFEVIQVRLYQCIIDSEKLGIDSSCINDILPGIFSIRWGSADD